MEVEAELGQKALGVPTTVGERGGCGHVQVVVEEQFLCGCL